MDGIGRECGRDKSSPFCGRRSKNPASILACFEKGAVRISPCSQTKGLSFGLIRVVYVIFDIQASSLSLGSSHQFFAGHGAWWGKPHPTTDESMFQGMAAACGLLESLQSDHAMIRLQGILPERRLSGRKKAICRSPGFPRFPKSKSARIGEICGSIAAWAEAHPT